MFFSSYKFFAFFVVCVALYYLLPHRMQWMLLLAGSYVFYFLAGGLCDAGFDLAGACGFVLTLILVSVVTWACALFIDLFSQRRRVHLEANGAHLTKEAKRVYREATERKKRRIMLAGLLTALAILGVFKYMDFAIDNLHALVWNFREDFELDYPDLILPMGISFYTFQSLGYLLDVYWEKIRPQRNPAKYLLFVSFFPQLVQGPISRYASLAPKLYEAHAFDGRGVCFGLERMLWGYFKKLVVADTILPAVQSITGDEYYSGAWVFVGIIFYGIELYADFTGGIDIAIGIAEVFGIRLEENFIRPYFSKSITEYWRRWHISMGAWFRDYVFYPVSISGSAGRVTKFCKKWFGREAARRAPVYLATMAAWLATGLWHGASWSFIVWGVMNAVVILLSGELEPVYRRFHARFPGLQERWAYRAFQIVRTFLLMGCLRLFDCYRDVPLAFGMFFRMFRDFDITALSAEEFFFLGPGPGQYAVILFGTALMLAVSLCGRRGSVREQLAQKPYALRAGVFALLLVLVLTCGAYGVGYDRTQFIYNQF